MTDSTLGQALLGQTILGSTPANPAPNGLLESEWMIGGVRFGNLQTSGLCIENVELGEWDIDDSDEPNPTGNGIIPGVDYTRGATWTFNVYTAFTENSPDAFAEMGRLIKVWAGARNLGAGQMHILRFCAGGKQFYVRGRARRFTHPSPGLLARLGKVSSTLEFRVMDPNVYEVTLNGSLTNTKTLKLYTEIDEGGVYWNDPVGGTDTEFYWDSNPELTRPSLMDNPSATPVDFKLAIHGPISSPIVASNSGWKMAFTARGGLVIPHDRYVMVDTQTRTAVWDDGVTAAHYLDRESSLDVKFPPGKFELYVMGTDSTLTSTFVFSWATAYQSIM